MARYSLYRVHPIDESEEHVDTFPSYVAGLQAGEQAADEHEDDTFILRSDCREGEFWKFATASNS